MSNKNVTTSPRALQHRLKAQAALELRLLGKSYPEISEALEYSGPGAVFNAISRLLRHHEMDGVEELRKIETSRLDTMLVGVWAGASTGRKEDIDIVLKIMKRRAGLLGLDTPVKIEAEITMKRLLLLKIGGRPPRLIDLDHLDITTLSDEELQVLQDIPDTIEGEFKVLPPPKEEEEDGQLPESG